MAWITRYLYLLFPLLIPVLASTPEPRTNAVTDPTGDLLRLPSSRNLSAYAEILQDISSIVNSSDSRDASQNLELAPTNSSPQLSLENLGGALGASPLICDEVLWGASNFASCQQAIDSIPSNNNLFMIGRRGNKGDYGITLPWRIVSRKYISCVIHPSHIRIVGRIYPGPRS